MIRSLPEGFLLDAEAEALAELARGRVVLEVGSYLGRSTVAMARTAEKVFAIDHHGGSAEHRSGRCTGLVDTLTGERSTLRRFLANLEEAGVREKVIPLVGTFEEIAPRLGPVFDFAFIDAEHDVESVKRHGELAVKYCLRDSSPIAFHDYVSWPEVRLAVDDLRELWHCSFRVAPDTSLAVLR